MKKLFILITLIFIAEKSFAQNQAIQFGNPYITVTNGGPTSALNITNSDLTLEAWIRPTAFSGFNNFEHTILGNDSIVTGSGGGYVFRTGGTRKLSFSFYDGASWQEVATNDGILETNMWQHIAVTKQGNVITLYVNGVNIPSNVISGSAIISSSKKKMKIGENGSLSNRKFNGRIDEVKVWNVLRTQQQVQSDGKEICGVYPSGLVAYYKLNDIGSLTANPILCANTSVLDGVINGYIQSFGGAILYPTNITEIYVDSAQATGCGLQDGSSWATAFSDLNAAITVSQNNPAVQKIYVAKGTYHPMNYPFAMLSTGVSIESLGTGKTFHIREGLELYGGYPTGGGVAIPSVHRTILDGSMAGGIITDSANNVVYMETSMSWTTPNDTNKLIGFTIRNGKANLNGTVIGQSLGYGAGVYCGGGILLIDNCVITQNKSQEIGSGIAVVNAIVLMKDDTITNNISIGNDGGGGIRTMQCAFELANSYVADNSLIGVHSQGGNLKLYNNTIRGNDSDGVVQYAAHSKIYNNLISHNARGIRAVGNDTTFITDNIIEDNGGSGIDLQWGVNYMLHNIIRRDTSLNGGGSSGGGINYYYGDNIIVGNQLYENVAVIGGGIFGFNGTGRIDSNIVRNNTAEAYGGMYVQSPDTISNNIIVGNFASSHEGGIKIYTYNAVVINNLIAFNSSPIVGGVNIEGTNIQFINNTVYNNRATDSSVQWNSGGMTIYNGTIAVNNNIFWENKIGSSETAPGSDYCRATSPFYSEPTFKYNILQRPASAYTTSWSGMFDIGFDASDNSFMTDPMFADTANPIGYDGVWGTSDDGLHLLYASPFMDGGSNSLFPTTMTEDVTGAQRIYGSAIDLGAYELGCAPSDVTPFGQDVLCSSSGSFILQANTAAPPLNIHWYADSTSSTVLGTGYSYTTPLLTGADTFWVSVSGCVNTGRVPVIITTSTPSTTVQNVSECNSFLWNSNGVNYTVSGVYFDTLMNVTGCDSFVTLNLTINNASANVTQNGSELQANTGAASYQWLTCNPYNEISGANSSGYTVTASGSYAVSIMENGCADTSACVLVTLGVEDMERGSLAMTPNPTCDVVKISLPSTLRNGTIQVRNAIGQIVLSQTVNSAQSLSMDLSKLPGGLYQVECSDGVSRYTGKLLKL